MDKDNISVKIFPIPNCEICEHYGIETKAMYDARMPIGDWYYMCKSCYEKNGIGLGPGKGHRIEYMISKIDENFNSLHKIGIRVIHLNQIVECFEIYEHLVKPVVLSILSYEHARIEVFDYNNEKFHEVDRGKTTLDGSLNVVISKQNHRIYYNMPNHLLIWDIE